MGGNRKEYRKTKLICLDKLEVKKLKKLKGTATIVFSKENRL